MRMITKKETNVTVVDTKSFELLGKKYIHEHSRIFEFIDGEFVFKTDLSIVAKNHSVEDIIGRGFVAQSVGVVNGEFVAVSVTTAISTSDFVNFKITKIASSGSYNFISTTGRLFKIDSRGGVIEYSDDLINWSTSTVFNDDTQIESHSTDTRYVDIVSNENGSVLGYVSEAGIYYSRDGGETWHSYKKHNMLRVSRTFIVGDYLFVAANGGNLIVVDTSSGKCVYTNQNFEVLIKDAFSESLVSDDEFQRLKLSSTARLSFMQSYFIGLMMDSNASDICDTLHKNNTVMLDSLYFTRDGDTNVLIATINNYIVRWDNKKIAKVVYEISGDSIISIIHGSLYIAHPHGYKHYDLDLNVLDAKINIDMQEFHRNIHIGDVTFGNHGNLCGFVYSLDGGEQYNHCNYHINDNCHMMRSMLSKFDDAYDDHVYGTVDGVDAVVSYSRKGIFAITKDGINFELSYPRYENSSDIWEPHAKVLHVTHCDGLWTIMVIVEQSLQILTTRDFNTWNISPTNEDSGIVFRGRIYNFFVNKNRKFIIVAEGDDSIFHYDIFDDASMGKGTAISIDCEGEWCYMVGESAQSYDGHYLLSVVEDGDEITIVSVDGYIWKRLISHDGYLLLSPTTTSRDGGFIGVNRNSGSIFETITSNNFLEWEESAPTVATTIGTELRVWVNELEGPHIDRLTQIEMAGASNRSYLYGITTTIDRKESPFDLFIMTKDKATIITNCIESGKNVGIMATKNKIVIRDDSETITVVELDEWPLNG